MIRTPARALSLLLGLALVAAGCGGDDDGDTAAPAAEATSTTPGGTATTAAATGTGGASGGAQGAGAATCPQLQGATIGYAQPLPDPNFKLLGDVIQADLDEAGAKLAVTNANLDPGKQISDIQTLLQQGVKALITNPIDPNAVRPALDQVRSRNVPIVVQETTVGGPYATNVTSDVEEAARQGAQILKEKVGDGPVAAIEGPTIAEIIVRENQSFAQGAQQAGLNVVEKQTNVQITPDKAREIAQAYKQKYGADLKGLWTFNDTSAVGAASALDATFKPAIVSINGQPEAIDAIKAGRMTATFDLELVKIGHTLAYAARQAVCGQPLPSTVRVPLKRIDSSNVGQWQPPQEVREDPFTVRFEDRDGATYLVTE